MARANTSHRPWDFDPRDVSPNTPTPQPEMPVYTEDDFARDLDVVLAEVRELLIAKNRAYGDAALNPVRAASRAHPIEQIKVRIDDKISRLMRGSGEETEDVLADLRGYLVLLRIAERREKESRK